MMKHNLQQILFFFLLCSLALEAEAVEEKDWGIAIGYRIARIPYASAEKQVSEVVPLMFYDGDTFFIHGLYGGIHLLEKDDWQFNLIGRYRFFDIPARYQNAIRGDALDMGVDARYHLDADKDLHLQLMTDGEGNDYASVHLRAHWQHGSVELFPYAMLDYRSAHFNRHYYGFDGFPDPDTGLPLSNRLGAGIDLSIGSELRYHVWRNLFLIGRAQLSRINDASASSFTIERPVHGEVYMGIAFFNDPRQPGGGRLAAKPYLRLSHGWASPSDVGEILTFHTQGDPQNNQLSSVFYGHPISDSLFGFDAIDLYLTTGYVYHHAATPYTQTLAPGEGINTPEKAALPDNPCNGTSPCQLVYDSQPANEFVVAIKAYLNIDWPVHWRLGFAEGLSYIDSISNIEQREMDRKGYRGSNLMNYLDFSADIDLGDTFNSRMLRNLYAGVDVHHRSSIFETSSAFGRIRGGSNYVALYLQYHFE